MAGSEAHTSSEMPVKMSLRRPVDVMLSRTRSSCQALTVLRSMTLTVSGRTSASSSMSGPHRLSAEVVVTTVGTWRTCAAFAKATTLCLSSSRSVSRTPL